MSSVLEEIDGAVTTPQAKPQLHISAINMLSFCGEQFRRRYILKEKRPPGVAMIVGTATDRSVTANLQSKITDKKLLAIDQVKQIASDSLKTEWQTGIELDQEEAMLGAEKVKGNAIDKAVRLSVLHASNLAPVLDPTHVQRPWVVELNGYPLDLAGTIDVQEGSIAIRDTKTKAKSPSEGAADQDTQLTAYALAAKVIDGRAPEKVTLDCLVDNKVPVVKVFSSTRNEADFDAFLARVENAVLALQAGVFVPAKQTDPLCSPKYCGFFSTCKFVMQPKQFQIGGSK